jgi:hypothetical protein
MTTGRLFTFGCSLTNYYWPTWADILGRGRDYQNWGLPGLGNMGIFLQVIEAGYKHNIGPDDQVVIMWSYLGREDRYVKDRWIAPGNLIREYDADWIEKYFCEKGSLIKELGCMAATIHVLNNWGCKWKFLSVSDLIGTSVCDTDSDIDDLIIAFKEKNLEFFQKKNIDKNVIETYFDVFNSLTQPSLYNFLFKTYGTITPIKLNYKDSHPTPKVFLEFVKKTFPEYTIDNDCSQWIKDWEEKVINSTNPKDLKKLYQPNRF